MPLDMRSPLLLILSLSYFNPLCVASDFQLSEADRERIAQVHLENQPIADQGNGTYRNPILPGHYHDPTVLRLEDDYYLSHCEHDRRGPIIWHSRDLVNWRPLTRIESLAGRGEIWATDLVYHKNKYYLYLPLRQKTPDGSLSFSNYVVTAEHPSGPWSDPIDLKIGGIDPGHIATPEGERFIYVNKGIAYPLSRDGTQVTGEAVDAYQSWPIPEDWTIECGCLESPKLFWKNDWYYLVSALGGTAGPATSHMVVVARSCTPIGPWENAPNSPLLRTWDRSEDWWSQGHGTIIEATDGSWWMLYHGIVHGRRSGGRNTLMLPISWTDDDWPFIAEPPTASGVYPKPAGENVGHGMPLSDDFTSDTLAIQWDLLEKMSDFTERIQSGGGELRMTASGNEIGNATRIAQLPVNESYELTVKVHTENGAIAGIGMTSSHGFVGLELNDGRIIHPRRGRPSAPETYSDNTAWLRIRNVDHDVTFYHSVDGINWRKHPWGATLSTESVQRIVLASWGKGIATFEAYRYRGLD